MSRIVTLPPVGRLLAVTDLHGNLADFHAIAARFKSLVAVPGPPPHLLFCGDLVHGPAIALTAWPEHLGDFYVDQTPRLLSEARQLATAFPGQIHFLLGNHEHAHLGGPQLSKFHPDEAAYLEGQYAAGDFDAIRQWMAGWLLAVVAPAAGIAFTHAAPHAQISGPGDLDNLKLAGYESVPLVDMSSTGPLGALLWARTTSAERAFAFLRALDPGCRVAVFGHDIVREGHLIEHEPLLCVSSSFGCYNGDKVYLEWDLARPAGSAAEVARAGLRPLYPDARPVHRT
ncbi:metallophosphoesterase [Dactylosporangium aurantiacum]|uniref:Metallophosphoesterase n=1 Tax=Dactylosporangium aurantiacum TaxID=35754 RepID=A0A9Q9IL40_9ACTN|nr:metallophosphoesterase [Dactylosporangium aurantiacum]MDG6100928.1 metallophosphoesterase [Dactylosporangium aurantiacum]UWZ55018.1 metallophosphoesterase [Dactylosporangium aurantiacum]